MKCIYVTCGENGLYGLRRLKQKGIQISAVVTIPPDVAAKAKVSGYCDVSYWVRQNEIDLISLKTYNLKNEDISAIDANLLIVNGWNRLIEKNVLDNMSMGGLGIHAGHPPIGLGRAPLVWNILLGHRDIEVYVFRMTPEADNGDIMARQSVEITPWDTVRTLYEKVMMTGSNLFELAIGRLVLGFKGDKQALQFAEHYSGRTPADGLIDFSWNEMKIHDFVRAQVPPYPCAFTYLNGVRWKILEAVPFDQFAFRDEVRIPGRIVSALPSGLIVQTGGAPVWILSAESEAGDQLPTNLEIMEGLVGQRFTQCPWE